MRTSLPPGPRMPRGLTTVGWFFRPLPLLERWRRELGDTFTMRIAGENTWVVLSDPEDVKTVFQGDPRLLHAGAANQILRPVLGDQSILLLDERAHMVQRKLLLPPFHGERMQRHEETMRRVAADEVASWPHGEAFALHPRMQRLTLEVIMRVVFGINEAGRLAQLRTALTRFVDFSARTRTFAAFAVLGPDRVRRAAFFTRALEPLDALLLDEIAERRRAPDLDERDDILSMLVQARHED
ncbi:MAG: cytochrome, partial [Acidobacteria bacterium]|nr:cytochrome [Acidobacteriota bacterium]